VSPPPGCISAAAAGIEMKRVRTIITSLAVIIMAASLIAVIALPTDHPSFRVLPLDCTLCRSALEPSGIAFIKGTPVIVSDNGDPTLYRLDIKERGASVLPFAGINLPPGLLRLKRHPLDLEGIAALGSFLYAVDERDRLVYRVDERGNADLVWHDIKRYNREKRIRFSREANAAFEGIAADPGRRRFYIANERDDAIIYTLESSADGLRLHTTGHLSMSGLTGDGRFDISDLFFDNGRLYVLYRRAGRIVKIDPDSNLIVGNLDTDFAVSGHYHSPKGFGFAEGLYMTRREIFLLLDGGGKAMTSGRGGKNGALVVLDRPAGF